VTDSVGQKTRSGLYWNLGLKVPFEVVRFAVSIVIARLLDPSDFGVVSIATMLIYYANALTNMGFNQALVQHKDIDNRHISSVFTIDLIISCVLASLLYLVAPEIAIYFNSPESKNVIRVMSAIFIITTIHDLPYALLRRNLEYRLISIVDTVKETGVLAVSLTLAFLGFDYWSIVWGQLLPPSLAAIFIYMNNRQKPALTIHWRSVRELMDFGLWSFIRSQIYFFSTRIDRIIIGKFWGIHTLGIYDKGKSLSQMPNELISTNINTVLFSSVSRIQCNNDELTQMMKKGLLVTSILNVPIYFGLYAIAPVFVPVVLGTKWVPMITPLQIMCATGVFASLNGLMSVLAVGVNEYQRYTIQQVITTILLIVLCLLLVPYGPEAVAGGVVFYSAVTLLMGLSLIMRRVNVGWAEMVACLLPAFGGSVIMLACVKVSCLVLQGGESALSLVGQIVVGVVAYCAAILVMPYGPLKEVRVSLTRDLNWLGMKGKFAAGGK
jgi:O-antigen/teichoic acid export membrane protein